MLTKKDRELVDYILNKKHNARPFRSTTVLEEPKPVEVNVNVNLDYVAEDIVDGIWDII